MGKSYTTTSIDQSQRQLAEGALNVEGTQNKVGTSDIILEGGSSYTTTDHNAVESAFGFGKETAGLMSMFGERALAAVDNANARISNVLDEKAKAVPALQDALTQRAPAVPVWAWFVGGAVLLGVLGLLVKKG